jgi:GT2 family glycosyltransferase
LGRLSIVTTIYTEERLKFFADLVTSVRKQQVIPEMIVVVERSFKVKEEVERILSNQNIHSKVIFSEKHLGLANARNAGASSSNTDYVGFIDDDAILDSHWSYNVINDLDASDEAIGVTGLTFPRWVNSRDEWFPRPLYWLIGCSDTRVINRKCFVSWASGTNMAFRRSLFKSYRFDEKRGGTKLGKSLNLPNDENEFVLRVIKETGGKIIFDPSIIVYHNVSHYKISNRYIRKYSLMQGYAEAEYRNKYSGNPRNSLGVLLLLALFREIFCEKTPNAHKKMLVIAEVVTFAAFGYLLYLISHSLT